MSKGFKKVLIGAIVLSLAFIVTSIFAPQIKAAAWSKNSKGQFVNDEGDVIPGATMKGVDVSEWNGKIDWAKVKKTDVDFAIIRCGYGDNYTYQDDKYFAKNIKGCEDNDIPYGIYIYSYAASTTQAKSEANHVLRLVKGHKLSFPIYYDMEENSQASLGKTKVGKLAKKFLDTIRGAGYQAGVYANLNWWTNYIPSSVAQNVLWFKWVAQYNSTLWYKGALNMWQCTSTGRVKGISGDVDINFWFGNYNPAWFGMMPQTEKVAKKDDLPGKVTIKSIKAGKKKLKVKWKKVSKAKGYRLQYSTSKKFKKVKNKYTKKTSYTIKKLKKKKKYYVRMKSYVKNSVGRKIYSKKWSKTKSKKTK